MKAKTKGQSKPATVDSGPGTVDLSPYAGRWAALVRGQVAGVGATEAEARHAAKHQRPKEEPTVVFVPGPTTQNPETT
jgi:hypothetical protein